MPRIALILLVASSALFAQTQSPAPPSVPPAWLRVEHLQPGDPIAVVEQGQSSRLTSCMMDQADDQSLSCIVQSPYAASRTLIFPIASVAAVYTEDFTSGSSHVGLYLAGGLGAFLGGGLCSQTDVKTALICAAIGASLAVSFVLSHPYPGPPPPQRLHRHLVYKAP